jgi:hypothetical protein
MVPITLSTEALLTPRVATLEVRREEVVQRVHQQHGKAHVAERGREPVPPGDLESGEFAEALPRVRVDTCSHVGLDVGEHLERPGQEEDA